MRGSRFAAIGVVGAALLWQAEVRGEQVGGTVRCKGVRDCANTVVYVAAIPGQTFAPPKQPVIMDQKRMQFTPHVLPVVVGTTVDFHNSDPLLHNVFTPDACADKFNLGTWPPGQVRSYTFKRECVAALLCNPHPEMLGYVLAVPTPFFTVTDRTGRWSLANLPAGEFTIKVWHPRLKGTSKVVQVPAAGPVDFDIAR